MYKFAFALTLMVAGLFIWRALDPAGVARFDAKMAARIPGPVKTTAADQTAAPKVNRWYICNAAHDHIRGALKAPASAQFPNCYRQDDEVNVKAAPDVTGGYYVTTWADAQNSFGATLRGYYMCAVRTPDEEHAQVSCLETDRTHSKTLQIF